MIMYGNHGNTFCWQLCVKADLQQTPMLLGDTVYVCVCLSLARTSYSLASSANGGNTDPGTQTNLLRIDANVSKNPHRVENGPIQLTS